MFSKGIEGEHWPEMGQSKKIGAIKNIQFTLIFQAGEYFYCMKTLLLGYKLIFL